MISRQATRGHWQGMALVGALALAGCAGGKTSEPAPVEYRGTDPAASERPAERPARTDIRQRDGYATAVARKGDTVASLAERVGVPAGALAAYNGRGPGQTLRAGAELVLPPRPEGYADAATQDTSRDAGSRADENAPARPEAEIEDAPLRDSNEDAPAAPDSGWSPDLAAAAIERADDGEDEETRTETAAPGESRLTAPPSSSDPLPPDPEPAPELASPRLSQYQSPPAGEENTSAEASGQAGETGSREGRRSDSPPPSSRPAGEGRGTTPQPERRARRGDTSPASTGTAREEAVDPPEETREAAAPPAASAGSGRFQTPVSGRVAVGFGPTGDGTRNEGIDFAAPAGAPVVAAADGEVALVSRALGGLGTIVLLRHPDDILTVYGRLSDVSVAKGDLVSRGQRIGRVAQPEPPAEPRMHFEVRQGAQAVDPTSYLGG